MNVDTKTKVVLLPNPGHYTIVSMPISRDLTLTKSMLIRDGAVLEVNKVQGRRAEKDAKLTNGEAVKSLIFESKDQPGFVLQSPQLSVGSRYNMAYLIISIMLTNQDHYTKRFITLEDIIDSFAEKYPGWADLVSNETYVQALKPICEVICENDEYFYKFSVAKAVEFVDAKVHRLKAHFEQQNDTLSIYRLMKQEIIDPTSTDLPPPEVTHQLALKHAIDFIGDSYCLPELKDMIQSKYEFKLLDEYLDTIAAKKNNLKVVEQGMSMVVQSTSEVKKKKPVKTVKKMVKKVAVGKGALDGFFKRA